MYRMLRSLTVALVCSSMMLGTASGCFTPRTATPEEMKTLGTRIYSAHSPDAVKAAVVTTLKLQGYEIVTDTPRIRTAPKLVAVSAEGGNGVAQTYSESVAWDIDIQPSGSGSVLHAEPRASVNGMPMEQVYYSWAEASFKALYKDIDDNLSQPSAQSGAAAAPAPSAPH